MRATRGCDQGCSRCCATRNSITPQSGCSTRSDGRPPRSIDRVRRTSPSGSVYSPRRARSTPAGAARSQHSSCGPSQRSGIGVLVPTASVADCRAGGFAFSWIQRRKLDGRIVPCPRESLPATGPVIVTRRSTGRVVELARRRTRTTVRLLSWTRIVLPVTIGFTAVAAKASQKRDLTRRFLSGSATFCATLSAPSAPASGDASTVPLP